MPIVVQKYGGTSVGDTDRIRSVADRIVRQREQGRDVVVVSAMGTSPMTSSTRPRTSRPSLQVVPLQAGISPDAFVLIRQQGSERWKGP
jgi:aspartate kinase